jgi:3-deoxy-manno-octulosonate cytidylyltransferase (CMP-KDO synthetase)
MKVAVVIPARLASTRLPNKPLVDLGGAPLIQRVWEQTRKLRGIDRLVVAVDDAQVAHVVQSFGGEAVLTDPAHASGTDRLTEVMTKVEADLFLNVQGDEPFVRPSDLETLVEGMKRTSAEVGTLCHAMDPQEAESPHNVKVVLAADGTALYFSRALIPFPRDADSTPAFRKHVGVYAYRREVLERYPGLPPSPLEVCEKLEQLRLLSAGIRIRVWEVEPVGPGIDTPEDLAEARIRWAAGHQP